MKLSKKIMVAAAVGALGVASAVPAMALENEFHGMYRAYGYMSNALQNGGFKLEDGARTDKYIEQRARLQYIAKASDDLKLITHFELDSRFGGSTGGKYQTSDAGALDADQVTLETKNVYLDFKIPSTPIRATVGLQPFNDAFGGLYGNFDATGAVFKGNFGALTATYGYFTVNNTGTTAPMTGSNDGAQDLNVLDAKFAINKDITVGASYYMLLDKVGEATVTNNTVGLNATAKVGPATIMANYGLQFGKQNTPGTSALTGSNGPVLGATGTTAMAASVAAKIAVGPGKINVAALYLSGDNNDANDPHSKAWKSIGTNVNYFTPANMWLLTRNVATINTSTSIIGIDLTNGSKGLLGAFAGYEGAAGKVFYNGNIGYAKAAMKRNANSSSIGTELNATVGYKIYSNLSAQVTAAYLILGDGYGKENAVLLDGTTQLKSYDNPYMGAIALNYAF